MTTIPDDIQRCVDHYLAGMWQVDRARLEAAFHPEARIAGPDDGALATMDLAAFVALVERQAPSGPLPAEVLSVRVDGDIATVVIRDDFLRRTFVDS